MQSDTDVPAGQGRHTHLSDWGQGRHSCHVRTGKPSGPQHRGPCPKARPRHRLPDRFRALGGHARRVLRAGEGSSWQGDGGQAGWLALQPRVGRLGWHTLSGELPGSLRPGGALGHGGALTSLLRTTPMKSAWGGRATMSSAS